MLLYLAISGIFMIKGRLGLKWRGAVLISLGVAVPVAYVVLSGGPNAHQSEVAKAPAREPTPQRPPARLPAPERPPVRTPPPTMDVPAVEPLPERLPVRTRSDLPPVQTPAPERTPARVPF
jgi:hypothetical protein